MRNFIKYLMYSLILVVVFIFSKSPSIVRGQTTSQDNFHYLEEQQQALSYFNIYRGNSHSHTIYTWTHGAHRDKGILDLDLPLNFIRTGMFRREWIGRITKQLA